MINNSEICNVSSMNILCGRMRKKLWKSVLRNSERLLSQLTGYRCIRKCRSSEYMVRFVNLWRISQVTGLSMLRWGKMKQMYLNPINECSVSQYTEFSFSCLNRWLSHWVSTATIHVCRWRKNQSCRRQRRWLPNSLWSYHGHTGVIGFLLQTKSRTDRNLKTNSCHRRGPVIDLGTDQEDFEHRLVITTEFKWNESVTESSRG